LFVEELRRILVVICGSRVILMARLGDEVSLSVPWLRSGHWDTSRDCSILHGVAVSKGLGIEHAIAS
jgi:hypothetical protein